MTKIISDLLYRGQPVYEEWGDPGMTELRHFSRTTKRFPDKSWKPTGYVEIQATKIDRSRATVEPQIRSARARLYDIPGVKRKKEYGPRKKPAPPVPELGQKVTDEHGPLRCLAYAEGYVMVRRLNCVPGVFSLEKWNMLQQSANGQEDNHFGSGVEGGD